MNYRRPMRVCSKRCTPLVVDVCVGQVMSCLRQQAVNWDVPARSIYQISAIKFPALSGLVRTRLDSAIRVSLLHFQAMPARLASLAISEDAVSCLFMLFRQRGMFAMCCQAGGEDSLGRKP